MLKDVGLVSIRGEVFIPRSLYLLVLPTVKVLADAEIDYRDDV